MKQNKKETELYLPIKHFFEQNGYIVKAEVKNCDIICVLNQKLTVVEMKNSFNLKLIYQAIERMSFADFVYIAIRRPKNFRKKEVKHMLYILKKLNIGLITVSLDSEFKNVQVIFSPIINNKINSKKRKTIFNEFKNRKLDLNIGGSISSENIITAYRENSIQIACFLKFIKISSAKELKGLGCSKKTSSILQTNYYDWFFRYERGKYKLTKKAEEDLNNIKYKKIVDYYKEEVKKCLKLTEMKNVGAKVEENINSAIKEEMKKS